MDIGGLQKFSLSDYPGKISAIVFTRGCNLRCSFCHNPELVDPPRYCPALPKQVILQFLRSRVGRIQGVVITGGEPTIHPDLPAFCREVRNLGYSIKLDTNGTAPGLLRSMVADGLLDFIAMDIKGPLSSYTRIAGGSDRAPVDLAAISASIELVLRSRLPHEFRTTYADWLLSLEEVAAIGRMAQGCDSLVLQRFMPTKALDPEVLGRPSPSIELMEEIAHRLEETVGIRVSIR
jgi:pyruvate formate lyase activating enzyme